MRVAAIQRRKPSPDYTEELKRFDPEGIGLRIVCPSCHAVSWIKLSATRYRYGPLMITCPRACGMFAPLDAFSPVALAKQDAGHFDIDHTCQSDGAETLTNGAVFRCPVCAIENPRQIMRNLKESVIAKLEQTFDRDTLADLLGKIVGTFDGVMRACNKIAVSNQEVFRAEPGGESLVEHPRVASFQNVAAARTKLLSKWDMASAVSDWNQFVLIFQKRHLFAHTLGVADEDYLNKSGDAETPLGKKVKLTKDDVIFFAGEAEKIVQHYFGHFLS